MVPPLADWLPWTYRTLVGREPTRAELDAGPAWRCQADLVDALLASDEFARHHPGTALPARGAVVIKLLAGGLRLHVDLGDVPFGPAIAHDAFEVAELAFATRWLRPGDCAVDGGAHVGLYAISMAGIVGGAGHVHAFEPHAPSADLLEASIAENRLASRLTLHRAALGASASRAWLTSSDGTTSGGHGRMDALDSPARPGSSRTVVPVVALDDLRMVGRVRLVKLDVEGKEAEALAGARRLLTEHRPAVLCDVERQDGADGSARAIFDTMAAFGYRAHLIASDGRPGAEIDLVRHAGQHVAFVPREARQVTISARCRDTRD